MLIAPVAFAAVCFQTSTATIQLHHTRPSAMIDRMRGFYFPNGGNWPFRRADDVHAVLYVSGTDEEIANARQLVTMTDVARREVSVSVSIDSKIDFVRYDVSAKLLNEQQWVTSDVETKTKLTLVPRINNDGTVTVTCRYQHGEEPGVDLLFRLNPEKSLELSKMIAKQSDSPVPEITIKASPLDE